MAVFNIWHTPCNVNFGKKYFDESDTYIMSLFSTLQPQQIIPSANPVNNGQTSVDVARERAEKEKVDFLNLLLTQLSNQNPLDPMDTDEWTAQLTRYSILEQGIETNENLSVTNDLLRSNTTAASFSYIGKEVEVETNMNVVKDGEATWSYVVEGNPDDVILTVTDENGTRLGEFDGSIGLGVQQFTFDASQLNLAEGAPVYLSIRATEGVDENKLNTRSTAKLKVDGVWSNQDESYLTAGALSFRTSDILKIVEGNGTAPAPAQQPPI
jgi:flagellar basal-body rod modification protein FlgD